MLPIFISHFTWFRKNKTMQIIGLCFNIMNEMCVIWKKVKVCPPPPPLVRSFWERWTGRSPFHFLHSFCARHLLSKQGHQFANSPHSYMIDNRKPLSGADYNFFLSACATPHVLWKNAAPGGCPVRPCQKPPLVGGYVVTNNFLVFKTQQLDLVNLIAE